MYPAHSTIVNHPCHPTATPDLAPCDTSGIACVPHVRPTSRQLSHDEQRTFNTAAKLLCVPAPVVHATICTLDPVKARFAAEIPRAEHHSVPLRLEPRHYTAQLPPPVLPVPSADTPPPANFAPSVRSHQFSANLVRRPYRTRCCATPRPRPSALRRSSITGPTRLPFRNRLNDRGRLVHCTPPPSPKLELTRLPIHRPASCAAPLVPLLLGLARTPPHTDVSYRPGPTFTAVE